MQLIVFYASVKFHQNIPYSNRAPGKIRVSYTAAVTVAVGYSPVCRLSDTLYTRQPCEYTRPPYQWHLTAVDGFSDRSCF